VATEATATFSGPRLASLGGWCLSRVQMLAFWVWTSQNNRRVFILAEVGAVTVGLAPRQADLMKGTASFVTGRVKENSIFAVLHRECHVLSPMSCSPTCSLAPGGGRCRPGS
jgi:hypothetical protein